MIYFLYIDISISLRNGIALPRGFSKITLFFVKYFCNTCFCFVLCIHLVPSYNSLLMFVSNFSVFLIIILMYLFTFFIYLFTYSVNKNLDFITHLFIYYLWIYTVSKSSDFVIYLFTYLFASLFIYMNCSISVHT